jgi:hypothetical protein
MPESLLPPPIPRHIQAVDIRVCQQCGAEAWAGIPEDRHPHYLGCPKLAKEGAQDDD